MLFDNDISVKCNYDAKKISYPMIGEYIVNEDTKYYQISDICPNITNYEEFEHYMNTYRKTEVSPNQRNFIFLKNHLTTKRAELLQKILDLNKR